VAARATALEGGAIASSTDLSGTARPAVLRRMTGDEMHQYFC